VAALDERDAKRGVERRTSALAASENALKAALEEKARLS